MSVPPRPSPWLVQYLTEPPPYRIEDYSGNTSGHEPNTSVAKPIKEVPNYNNQAAQATYNKIGEFVYDQDEDDDKQLPRLGPYEFENGAVYIGQWRQGVRHGRGKQYWNDGSFYEGYWRNNMANGKGRLIHAGKYPPQYKKRTL